VDWGAAFGRGASYWLNAVYPGEAGFDEARALSATEYRRHFDCTLRHAYPAYFCLYRGHRLQAVCGFRSATRSLFLDQYLDAPAWELAGIEFGRLIAPQQLVELGGFAVRKRALALPFMTTLAPALERSGFTHATATATLPVRRCLRRLGVDLRHLGNADASRLRDCDSDWGTYYNMRPAVVVGAIADALATLRVQMTC
jgi:hypothetical protein